MIILCEDDMKSKSLIKKQTERKRSSLLVKTILSAKKNSGWKEVAEMLSSPRKKRIEVNLSRINSEMKKGVIVVPGKVLSQGGVNKKIKVAALNFSEKAKEKLLKSGSQFSSILEEIKKNPEAKEITILK